MTKCNNIHPRQDATFKSLDYLVPYYPQVYLCLNLSRVTFLTQTVWYKFIARAESTVGAERWPKGVRMSL